jgi:choline dehydrogenase-like flavoprotein
MSSRANSAATAKQKTGPKQASRIEGCEAAGQFDAIVLGSGATGSWAAKLLTEGGLTVLVLDSGFIPDQPDSTNHSPGGIRAELPTGRQETQSQCYAFSPTTRHLFVDDIDQPYETPTGKPFSWIRTRVIGGRTALWFGVSLRMSDRQFGAASLDGFGIDWPIRYDDLRLHYDLAERFLGVSGIEAKLDEIPDGVFQPTTLTHSGRLFQQAIHEQWPDRTVTALRRARASQPSSTDAHGRGQHVHLPTCSARDALSAADATGLMVLRPNARAIEIMTDRSGSRAQGVVYADCLTGKQTEVFGKVVILCASTIETTRLMLNSVSRTHPHGVGNLSGLLGKYLIDHTSGVSAIGLRSGWCGNTSEIYIPNFRNRGGCKTRFLRGYGIQGQIRPMDDQTIQCALGCFGEVLPRAENQVRLSDRKDKWGLPIPHITYTYSDNELEMAADQAMELERMLKLTGFDIASRQALSIPGRSIHEVGTARMGLDPKVSVLNPHNQCWNVSNLLVTDGASFPSVGFQNPTLTMMAVTGRACDYILREFARSSRQPFSE